MNSNISTEINYMNVNPNYNISESEINQQDIINIEVMRQYVKITIIFIIIFIIIILLLKEYISVFKIKEYLTINNY